MHKAIEIEIINNPTEIFVGKLEVNQDLAQQVVLNDSVCGLHSRGAQFESAILTEGLCGFPQFL
jgi:hypothetical protein